MNTCFFRVVAFGAGGSFEVTTPEGERVASSPDEQAVRVLSAALNEALAAADPAGKSVVIESDMQIGAVAVDCINCARFGMSQVAEPVGRAVL